MQNVDAKAAEWAELHKDWVFANQAARRARLNVTQKFKECALRRGSQPTEAELLEVEQLEHAADIAKLAEDTFIQGLFKAQS